MTDWGDIVNSAERFPPVGRKHGVRMVTDLVRGVDERGPQLAVEIHSDDLRLLMHRFVPVHEGAAWIDALTGLLDAPTEDLPHPDTWGDMTDELVQHRAALDDLPVVDPRQS